MRVLLLGPTGNLGLRLIPSLIAHGHHLTVFVRNPSKLRCLLSTELLDRIDGVVVGDATDSVALKRVLIDHDIEAIVDVAGNQVLPWKEYVLQKIAKAVSEAALEIGKERGRPLRIWVTSGLPILKIPGTDVMMQDYFPRLGRVQHDNTRAVMEEIPISDLTWSIIAVGWMTARDRKQGLFQPLDAPRHPDLLVEATTLPFWRNSWVERIPVVGMFIHCLCMLMTYCTELEVMADFLAEDLATGNEEWIGKKIGVLQRTKKNE